VPKHRDDHNDPGFVDPYSGPGYDPEELMTDEENEAEIQGQLEAAGVVDPDEPIQFLRPVPEAATVDPLLERGEPEEHFSEAEIKAAQETFEGLRRIQEEEGIHLEFDAPVSPVAPPVEHEPVGGPLVGFLGDVSGMNQKELFYALCRMMGDDPDEIIEDIRTLDDDGEEWLRERGIK
jgi:hypothetical protein